MKRSKRKESISKQKYRNEEEYDDAYEPTVDQEPNSMTQNTVSRKRKYNEVSTKAEYVSETNSKLFIDLYKPTKMSELSINPKKIKEFNEFMSLGNKKILIIQGPPG